MQASRVLLIAPLGGFLIWMLSFTGFLVELIIYAAIAATFFIGFGAVRFSARTLYKEHLEAASGAIWLSQLGSRLNAISPHLPSHLHLDTRSLAASRILLALTMLGDIYFTRYLNFTDMYNSETALYAHL